MSEATYRRAQGGSEFEPPQTMMLKGVGEMPVYRLRRPPAPTLALVG